MFSAETHVWALTINPKYGEGTLATFLAIQPNDAKVHARALCKRLGVPKEKAVLRRCKTKAAWKYK